MSLTATDEATGAVIFPFDEGRSRAVCRDPECRAVMEAVHQVTDDSLGETVTIRRAYWRHRASADSARRCKSSRSDKTPWHIEWQMRCEDRERIEHRVGPKGRCRIADVYTRFKWALEFQHSNIDKATVARRENHYRGRVLWIVNADPASATSGGSLDFTDANLLWIAHPSWVIESKTLMAVDDGLYVHLLPPGGLRGYASAGELRVPRRLVRSLTHDEFTDSWINGDAMPLGGQPVTEWLQMSAARAERSRDQKAADARLTAQGDRRAAYQQQDAECGYTGNRGRLEYPAAPQRVARSIYRTKQPCEVCASEQSRPYLTGWLCDNHSPSAMKEHAR
jgi:hypothetical protein